MLGARILTRFPFSYRHKCDLKPFKVTIRTALLITKNNCDKTLVFSAARILTSLIPTASMICTTGRSTRFHNQASTQPARHPTNQVIKINLIILYRQTVWAPSIFGALQLVWWAMTHSLEDDGFYVHFPHVNADEQPFEISINGYLGALSGFSHTSRITIPDYPIWPTFRLHHKQEFN